MSLHTQLLRGLFALPVLLLLAVAGLTAPAPAARPHAVADGHPHTTLVIVADGRVAIASDAR